MNGIHPELLKQLKEAKADIRAKGTKAEAAEARAPTLPLGGDKWGSPLTFSGTSWALLSELLGSCSRSPAPSPAAAVTVGTLPLHQRVWCNLKP